MEIVIRCRRCLRREEYASDRLHEITLEILGDGWREWDRKTNEAVCRQCYKKQKDQPDVAL